MASAADETPAGGPAADEEEELFHVSLNPEGASTIVLLHGILGSHNEFATVTPFLTPSYHVLVPDLPGHSGSRDVPIGGVSAVADRVAALIRRRARGGRAHVAGMSLGGFVTLDLMRRHPDVLMSDEDQDEGEGGGGRGGGSVWVSGAVPFSGWQLWLSERPSLVYYAQTLVFGSPLLRLAEWVSGVHLGEALSRDVHGNLRWDLVQGYWPDLTAGMRAGAWDDDGEAYRADVRACLVSGGLQDNVAGMKKMAERMRELGTEARGKRTRAFVVRNGIHGWDVQFPELYANGIMAWIEGRPMPKEMEPCE